MTIIRWIPIPQTTNKPNRDTAPKGGKLLPKGLSKIANLALTLFS